MDKCQGRIFQDGPIPGGIWQTCDMWGCGSNLKKKSRINQKYTHLNKNRQTEIHICLALHIHTNTKRQYISHPVHGKLDNPPLIGYFNSMNKCRLFSQQRLDYWRQGPISGPKNACTAPRLPKKMVLWYFWWKKSCTSWYGEYQYPIFDTVRFQIYISINIHILHITHIYIYIYTYTYIYMYVKRVVSWSTEPSTLGGASLHVITAKYGGETFRPAASN